MRALILILLLSCLALATEDTISIPVGLLYDAALTENTTGNNRNRTWGGKTLIELDSSSSGDNKVFLIWTDGLDTLTSLKNRVIKSVRLKMKTTMIGTAGSLSVYRVDPDLDLQEGNKANANAGGESYENFHPADGGATWNAYHRPTIDLSTGNLDSAVNWYDSGYVSLVKDQATFAGCVPHSVLSSVECAWRKKNYTGQATGFNVGDSTGADVAIVPEYQAEDSVAVQISSNNTTYSLKLTPNALNMGSDISMAIKFYAGHEGAFNIDRDNVTITLHYCDGSTGLYAEDSLTLGYAGGGIDIAPLYESDVDSVWATDSYDTIPMNEDYSVVLIKFENFKDTLDPSDTIGTFKWLGDSRIDLEVDSCHDACSVSVYVCYKNKWSSPTWRHWNSTTSKRWRGWGCRYTDEIDLSEQQIIECVPQYANICSVFSYITDTTYMVSEITFPYYANDTGSCPGFNSSDSVLQLGDYITVPARDKDTLCAALKYGSLYYAREYHSSIVAYEHGDSCFTIGSSATMLHAMTLVGYQQGRCDSDSLGFYFKNSWGTDWGYDGLGWFNYNEITPDGRYAWLPLIDTAQSLWQTPGCNGANDREQTAFNTVYGNSSSTITIPLDSTDAQECLTNGDQFGWLVVAQGNTILNFYSTETPTSSNQPTLEFIVESVSYFGKGRIGKCILGN